ncbi:uncharacterized protein LOC116300127 [Actinia tenebrosa]|uniref:Uncharacterized protein LOC116300127 n=1 Tax=Actinia tenebrosa TaxID=6105 RepID=A0A6P8IEU5_ACTTE|nr:uncharacterized protein LOC116300127 [Actinia tenebrosa]
MAVKSTSLLLVLVVIFTELPRSFSFSFTKKYDDPLVVYYRNRTNVKLRWEWTLGSGEIVAPIKIRRYRQGDSAKTEMIIGTYSASGNTHTDLTKYSLTVANQRNGYASFVIKDITNQGNNKDRSPIDVMKENEKYVYKIAVDEQTTGKEYSNEVELKVFKIPVITTYPRNQTVSEGTVTFQCAADGKPTPTITWEKIGSSQVFSQGSPLTITNFDTSKVGVYRCTAKSTGIAENASATAFVQFSTCGSGCDKEELAIEFTDLTYNYEYENPSYNKYKELKNKIETECLIAYALKGKTIHKCEVIRYRRGSVVAVVELGYPENTLDPKQPLLQAINDGNFAGYRVKTDFVSPTSITDLPSTHSSTHPPLKPLTHSPTPSHPSGSPESTATCSVAISFFVTIIVLLVFSNAVLGFLLWKKSSILKEVTKNRGRLAPNEHRPNTSTINDKILSLMVTRQPEVPSAPLYNDISNIGGNRASERQGQLYQTLDVNCQQPYQTYQTLDAACKNVNSPVETSVSDNYQALPDAMPPVIYGQLN